MVFFRPLVPLAVVDDILYEHHLVLPVNLTLLWIMLFLPLAFTFDIYFLLLDVMDFFKRIFFDDPGPLAAFIDLRIPILGGLLWDSLDLSLRLRVTHC